LLPDYHILVPDPRTSLKGARLWELGKRSLELERKIREQGELTERLEALEEALGSRSRLYGA
jgi:hypothetical protein